MENLIKFIRIDIVIQRILSLLICVSVVMLHYFPMTLWILGVWQLFSAIIVRAKMKDDFRKKYLKFNAGYLALMCASICYANYYASVDSGFLIFIMLLQFIVIPSGIAILYFVVSKNTFKDLEKQGIVDMPESMNEILDSEEIFRSIEK